MSKELTKKELYERGVELRNLRKLHTAARDRVVTQDAIIRQLKEEDVRKGETIALQQTQIDDLKLQLEELRTIVFGKKKRNDDTDHDIPTPRIQEKKPRIKDSYKRPVPEDVTEEVHHTLSTCPHCKGSVLSETTRTYYEEDIPLQQRNVRRHTVECGPCTTCDRMVSAIPLPCAKVLLGETVKRYIPYLSVICRLSYTQIRDVLRDTYCLAVSEGEIAKILERQSSILRPHYERLLESIRGEPSVHLDETGWNLFMGDGYHRYAWGMVGGASGDAVFTLGKTRGKGNATDLLADSTAVVVSDDYGAYRNLSQPHQLCCAHILRKVRDLAQSRALSDDVHAHCIETYHTFASIYTDIDTVRTSGKPMAQHDALLNRLKRFTILHSLDPTKLTRVKRQVSDRITCYLTCLQHPNVIPDNNPAERALRHLVLKRKISFGSFSEATAERLAVLTSVLMTFRRRGVLGRYLQEGV